MTELSDDELRRICMYPDPELLDRDEIEALQNALLAKLDAKPAAVAERTIESEEFYNVCQQYRHAPIYDPEKTATAYQELIDYVDKYCAASASAPVTANFMYEDQLPESMTDAEYNAWFAQSTLVDGVRMGPIFPAAPKVEE